MEFECCVWIEIATDDNFTFVVIVKYRNKNPAFENFKCFIPSPFLSYSVAMF